MAFGLSAGAIGAIGAVGGALIGANASQSAANTQAGAAAAASNNDLQINRENNALQKQIYDQNVALQEPFRQSGLAANNKLSTLMGLQPGAGSGDLARKFSAADFQTDPGYQFRLGEGQKAIENSAAARGSLLSGGAMKALQKYGQDFASTEYQNAYNRFNSDQTNQYNRYAGLAGTGQTATNAMNTASSNYGNAVNSNNSNTANNISSNMMSGANAQAAGQVGQANAWSSALGGAVNNYQQNQLMNLMSQNNKSPYTIY
jgi:hypothetical protein